MRRSSIRDVRDRSKVRELETVKSFWTTKDLLNALVMIRQLVIASHSAVQFYRRRRLLAPRRSVSAVAA